MARIKQKPAKKVRSLLSKKKAPSAEQLEETYFEQDELFLSSEDELRLEEEEEEDDEDVESTLDKKRHPATRRRTIFLGHIPHGFYEKEMKEFFTQFGEVTRIKVYRNEKTGKFQHYAHIEFANAKVAQIVAKTMDGYLMYGHELVCKVVPKKYRFAIFHRPKPQPPGYSRYLQYKRLNGCPTDLSKIKKATLKQLSDSSRKWKALGIQYDISSLVEKEFGSDVKLIHT
ncbi:hypothetical protein HMI54_014442 [Coelomomyces lativittatus]|nr:hypothetical protein HMI55_003589 [Coelomomyces lativittatus]KAJ1508294.1 hypothetical protein HMI56_007360 [Coelomomyces lativittatus]KAJ1514141.1 hypothetical protein HMI54_014442 [Coelomomyces lativittatus]